MNHIKMEHLPTKEMTSDILTKALAPTPFLYLRKKLLGMYSKVYTPNIINLFLTNLGVIDNTSTICKITVAF